MNGRVAKLCRRYAWATGSPLKSVKRHFLSLSRPDRRTARREMTEFVETTKRQQ